MTVSRDATAEDAGRICPFCRFPLKSGTEVTPCRSCATLHHSECWTENGGCAVLGCASAPQGQPPVWPEPVVTASTAPPPPRPPRTSAFLATAVLLLAVAIGGVAVALVVTRQSDAPEEVTTARADATATPTPTPTSTPAATPTETATLSPTRTPRPRPRRTPIAPDPNRAAIAGEIEAVIASYYDFVLGGDYAAAWALLSPTYKAWKADNGGYEKWVSQEQVHTERLDPYGMRLRLVSLDGDVATVSVTGMRFRSRSNSECDFHGVTWARRVNGRWLYDQGYLQSAARSARWRPVREQTLGYTCESDY